MAKSQTKKSSGDSSIRNWPRCNDSGQWIYEELLSRAIGGPRPRGDAYLWPWPWSTKNCSRPVTCRKRVSRHAAACCSAIPD